MTLTKHHAAILDRPPPQQHHHHQWQTVVVPWWGTTGRRTSSLRRPYAVPAVVKVYVFVVVLVTVLLLPVALFCHGNHPCWVDAFRAISVVPSSSLSSSSSLSFNVTRRRTKRGTLLWQQSPPQQQQQQQQEEGLRDETTTTTTTTVKQSSSSTTPPPPSRRSSVVLPGAMGLLCTAAIVAALTGVLPGYYATIDAGSSSTITSSNSLPMLQGSVLGRDVGTTLLTGLLGYAFVQVITYLTVTKQYLVSRDARKIIHTLSAPLFMLFWPLFEHHHPSSRVFAAIVPILNGIRLFIASQSPAQDSGSDQPDMSESALAQAVSRSGNSKEALGGPFIYVCMLAISIVAFWTESPHGIIAMSTLAAGDGMADIVGRRYGSKNPWPYNPRKSIAGSLAFVSASAVTSLALILWIQYTGSGLATLSSQYTTLEVATNILIISTVAAIVETIPWLGDDNYTVPISAALLSFILFS